jgi:hypothetical protein
MNTFFLVCFVLGLVLSLLAAFSGLGRLHLGQIRFGHVHVHSGAHMHTGAGTHAQGRPGGQISAFNGFTLPAFLCWFGGAGYLLLHYSPLVMPLVLLLAVASGLLGGGLLYLMLFKVLLPRERVLSAEDTRMDGVVARVSDEIRAGGGTGEILFTQLQAHRSAAARSEDGAAIARGTEVVVLRYSRGIAYVAPLEGLMNLSANR